MSTSHAVVAEDLTFRYGERLALDHVGFRVERGAAHGFLGPNGSGKSTLFKLLSTLVPLQEGRVELLGLDLAREPDAVRRKLGVVFQSPAVDQKLTVQENLRYGGLLLGLSGADLARRIDEKLEAARLADRRKDRVGELSGGLRRRVEIAKCLLAAPEVVLLDEASTGLDPAARADMWSMLRAQEGLTVLFTTHLMDEAAEADRLTLLDVGKVVASGPPAELVREIGGQVLEIEGGDLAELGQQLRAEHDCEPELVDGVLRLEGEKVHEYVPSVMQRHGDQVQRLQLSHPSLEDVFLRKTGRHFLAGEAPADPEPTSKKRGGRR